MGNINLLITHRDSLTVWCLCAFFPIVPQFYVPFYVKKKKMDNFMCLLEFECAERLRAHSQAIPALRCSRSIACQRCSDYIFIFDWTPGFNGLGKDNCKAKRETLSFEIWYVLYQRFDGKHVLSDIDITQCYVYHCTLVFFFLFFSNPWYFFFFFFSNPWNIMVFSSDMSERWILRLLPDLQFAEATKTFGISQDQGWILAWFFLS